MTRAVSAARAPRATRGASVERKARGVGVHWEILRQHVDGNVTTDVIGNSAKCGIESSSWRAGVNACSHKI